jgi:Subtilase family
VCIKQSRVARTPRKTIGVSASDQRDERAPPLRATSKNQTHPYFIAHDGAVRDKAVWKIPEICAAYNWPDLKEVAGGTIALIQLSGGWREEDTQEFFAEQGLVGKEPTVTDRSLDGGQTNNSNCSPPSEADSEVALDIQVAAAAYAVATGQSATIRVYWTKDLAAGLRAATDDECDVCCITWGADEQTWGRPAADAFNAAAKAAVDNGMIIVAASGDNDSSDGGPTPANVDFPASSPYVIGCGGTTRTKATKTAEAHEIVWNNTPRDPSGQGTGGGFSELFPIPDWQLGTVQARMRMVPDVAAHADPLTGYRIFVGGKPRIVGGTSAAAALYAGLFAAFGPKRGFITPELYKNQVCFNDIRDGDNGMFRAMVGPDPCTGIGSPRADLLAERIGSDAATLARIRTQLKQAFLDTPKADAPCTCQPTPFSGASPALTPRVASAPYHCVLSANGTWWKFPYDPITGLPTGPGVPAGPGECSASPALTPRVASAPYHCVLSANGTWWKFPYDPISGLRTGPGAPAGPGECS